MMVSVRDVLPCLSVCCTDGAEKSNNGTPAAEAPRQRPEPIPSPLSLQSNEAHVASIASVVEPEHVPELVDSADLPGGAELARVVGQCAEASAIAEKLLSDNAAIVQLAYPDYALESCTQIRTAVIVAEWHANTIFNHKAEIEAIRENARNGIASENDDAQCAALAGKVDTIFPKLKWQETRIARIQNYEKKFSPEAGVSAPRRKEVFIPYMRPSDANE